MHEVKTEILLHINSLQHIVTKYCAVKSLLKRKSHPCVFGVFYFKLHVDAQVEEHSGGKGIAIF